MRLSNCLLAACAALAFIPVSLMATHHLFIGTYTNAGSRGIYALRLDSETGALSTPLVAAETPHPTFLAFSPDRKFLYAVNNSTALAVGYAADATTGTLTPLPAGASTADKEPCYVAVDPTGRAVVVSHYHQGYVASLPRRADGTLGAPVSVLRHPGPGAAVNPARQDKPHVHSNTLSPDGRFALVCDLGLDRVYTYALDAATATLAPAATPFTATAPGTGPRHTAFSRDGRHVFVVGELNSTVNVFAYEPATGALSPRSVAALLPAGFMGENTAAEVRVSPDGRFVYASNRGHDSLAVFAWDETAERLTRIELVPVGGKNPRNFALSPDGRWLVAATQNSDLLTVFRVDLATGRLTPTPHTAQIPTPVCVLFAD